MTRDRFVVLATFAILAIIAWVINRSNPGYVCGVNDVAARGECSELFSLFDLNLIILGIYFIVIGILFFTKIPIWMLLVILIPLFLSNFAILALLSSVFFLDISTYERDTTFFGERTGIAINIIVMLGVFGFLGLLRGSKEENNDG